MSHYHQAAVILAGDPPKRDAAARLRALADQGGLLVVAADGGGQALAELGLAPQIIIGDGDSLPETLFGEVPRLSYAQRKNLTDGQAALGYALQQTDGRLYVFGAFGGRPDHFLANIMLPLYLAGGSQDVLSRFVLITDGCTAFYSSGSREITGKKGDLVSLIPLTAAHGIVLHGLEYPLCGYDALPGDSRTVSNVLSGERARIEHSDGILLICHLNEGGTYNERGQRHR